MSAGRNENSAILVLALGNFVLALGNLDLHTKQPVTWFDPDHVTLNLKSKYGSRAEHQVVFKIYMRFFRNSRIQVCFNKLSRSKR